MNKKYNLFYAIDQSIYSETYAQITENVRWPEATINYTMIYHIATMAIALWSMSLGYWNFTEIITCLWTLKRTTPVDMLLFSQSACKHTHVEKIIKSHPFQWILHKCHLTSMCSNGQYAAFSVNKMHISKNYILFPIKCTQTTQFKQDHQPEKI